MKHQSTKIIETVITMMKHIEQKHYALSMNYVSELIEHFRTNPIDFSATISTLQSCAEVNEAVMSEIPPKMSAKPLD
jgi:hypothetical protein